MVVVSVTSKPHAFSGAVLPPGHARELTPTMVLQLTKALADAVPKQLIAPPAQLPDPPSLLVNQQSQSLLMPIVNRSGHTTESILRPTQTQHSDLQMYGLTTSYSGGGSHSSSIHHTSSLSSPPLSPKRDGHDHHHSIFSSHTPAANAHPTQTGTLAFNEQQGGVQYTVWITQAWNILQWPEPSAALFWEMATMYHTLHVASRSIEIRCPTIPPILSTGSASSNVSGDAFNAGGAQGGGTNVYTETMKRAELNERGDGQSQHPSQQHKSSAASAKQLPVWLLGIFLLLHTEEGAFARNVSGKNTIERRFTKKGPDSPSSGGVGDGGESVLETSKGLKEEIAPFLPSLSPRTRIHASYSFLGNGSKFSSFLFKHLRKILLMCAIPHNSDACEAISEMVRKLSAVKRKPKSEEEEELYKKMEEEEQEEDEDEVFGNIGCRIHLTSADVDHLNFVLHRPHGGLIDAPPLRIADVLPFETDGNAFRSGINVSHGTVTVGVAEMQLKKLMKQQMQVQEQQLAEQHEEQLEKQLNNKGADDSSNIESINSGVEGLDLNSKGRDRKALQPQNQTIGGFWKELTYKGLRGTTIVLPPANTNDVDLGGRLHDLTVSNCSDCHLYLLRPFEHATITACTDCTIVVGAVAGLLNVLDCERITITSAARRILVINSLEVLNCCFTPSPPLLVGDNRSCQFAPYNSYYDGIRDDLLATGLAAAVLDPQTQNYYVDERRFLTFPSLQCASNKWKLSVELAKLEIPQLVNKGDSNESGSAAGGVGEDTMQTPVLLPPTEFRILFVPLESEAARIRRQGPASNPSHLSEKQHPDSVLVDDNGSSGDCSKGDQGEESDYCRNLSDILQLSPFRLPVEYERRALIGADRIRTLQQAIKADLKEKPDLQQRLEEELNRGFRDWLVSSGNLRQILDLVHMERRIET